MKKIYFLLLAGTILSMSAFAQDLKPFKVDVSLGYAIPSGTGSKGGMLFVIEPKYAVVPQISVGLRMEGTIVARFGGYDADGYPMDASVKFSSSYLATGDYYLTNNYKVHPFVGAGAGVFMLAGIESNQSSDNVSSGTKFGGMIRGGIELSHFRLGFEYNLVPKTTFVGVDQDGNTVTGMSSKNSYIGIKIGACFGGGPRSR
jgi:outer membrane protein X